MDGKKISIIIPVYNTMQYLERCMGTIVAQTYKNIEIILVDDGSLDGSSKLCDTYAQLYDNVIVIHKENGGLSSARNVGIQSATGEYLGFVDSDDWIAPNMFEYLHELILSNHCDIAGIGFSIVKTYKETKVVEVATCKIEVLIDDDILKYYFEKEDYSVCSKLYKKEVFDTVVFPEGMVNEDILTNYRIFSQCKKYVNSTVAMYYYFSNMQSITNGGLKKRDFDLLKICQMMLEEAITKQNIEIVEFARLKLYRSYFSLLAKIAYFGFSDQTLDQRQVKRYLISNLRKHCFCLMNSKISLNRKICITVFCVWFWPCQKFGSLMRLKKEENI